MVAVVGVEMGSAERRKSDFGIAECVSSVDLDKTFNESILPNCMSGACALPRVHGFVIASTAICDPGKKLQHQ
jgi:hypothetical protein